LANNPGVTGQIEDRIHSLGHEIFVRANRLSQSLTHPIHWLDESIINFGLRDADLKTQLFRFVDVLPALRDSGEVARHLREYLLEATRRKPRYRWAAAQIPQDGWLGPLVAAAAGWQVRRMARRFIAAADLPQAVAAIARLRRKRLGFTLDVLGEAVVCESEADQYQRQYLELLQALPPALAKLDFDPQIDGPPDRPLPRTNVSVKLSSLFSQFDPIDPQGTAAAVAASPHPAGGAPIRRVYQPGHGAVGVQGPDAGDF
jgi:RHH-type proline utilization regulon transcriptional repressor/proline dehydrogenase/delta 1-pyrroline-5-carboxylate dehydrogenase